MGLLGGGIISKVLHRGSGSLKAQDPPSWPTAEDSKKHNVKSPRSNAQAIPRMAYLKIKNGHLYAPKKSRGLF